MNLSAFSSLRAHFLKADLRRRIGAMLIICALLTAAFVWALTGFGATEATDNAYTHGDITSVAPRVSGYVTQVLVTDNEAVEQGDVLFRIDDAEYRARLAQAVSDVEAAEARLRTIDAERALQATLIRQAEAQRRYASAEHALAARTNERRQELSRRGFASRAALDESEAAQTRAAESLSAASAALSAQRARIGVLATSRETAIAALAQAQAARDLALLDLDNTIVRAPISGVVGNRHVRVGRFVSPAASLLDIVPLDDLWVVANFKETQLSRMRPGQHVRIRVDGYPGQSFAGIVDSFAPGSGATFSLLPADNASGNFVRVVQRVPVKIRFVAGSSPPRLVPGLSARVRVHLRSDRTRNG